MDPSKVYVLTMYDTQKQELTVLTLCGMHAQPLADDAHSVHEDDGEYGCSMCKARKGATILPFRSALMLCMAQHPAGKGRA